MRKMFKKWIEYRAIKKSDLFDPAYYLLHNPDVRRSGIDPLRHFVEHGWKEGRNPSQEFDTKYYLEANPDVSSAGINPLLHYLKFGQKEDRARNPIEHTSKLIMGAGGNPKAMKPEKSKELSDILDLLDFEPYLPVLSLEAPIDLLIPVYNGRELLDVLLTSIVNNTSIPYRLLIANDKSSDPLVSVYLQDFKNNYPSVDIIILENEENLGFVRTVNKLANLTQNHFVILNTDTEVPPYWLERLIYPILTNESIASTTPFSNAGVICSFPNFLEDNPIFENMEVAALDAFFQYVNVEKNYTEVPTAVGFCMGINKNVRARIGLFNEVFGKGYGEENDWCMRAIQAGYKNIIVPNLFVYHKHGGSFSSEEKKKLGDKNLELLRNMHPDYYTLVADFIQRDPLKYLRTILKIKILSNLVKPKIVLDHSLGGGANAYSQRLISKDDLSVVIVPNAKTYKDYIVRFDGQKINEISFHMENIRDIESIIRHFNVETIIINELVGYTKPRILDLVDFLVKLKKANDHINFTYIVHDFFSVCPIYNLLDYEIKYCGVPSDLSYCNKCLKLNPLMEISLPFAQKDYPNLTITLWREKFGNLLDYSSRIICFSQSSRDILQKAYPNLSEDKFEITPLAVEWVRPVVINKTSGTINIAVLGHLTTHKGVHMVSLLASYTDYYSLDITFHVFGDILDPAESECVGLLKTVVKHGAYKKTDLPKLMEDNEIDLVLAPSICPETFSYTAEEAMKMELPIAVFDYGAPAERVKLYSKGIILKKQDPDYITRKIYEYFNKDLVLRPDIKKDIVLVCVSNNNLVYTRNVLAFAYMTEHRILKYDNRETNTPISVRYNDAIDKLLTANYSGWIFFMHNDFSFLEPLDDIVNELDHDHLYGPIGAVLENNEKKMYGEILQGHNGSLICYGSRIDKPTLVDTVDCQCLFMHTDLLKKYPLRFDENELLSFHQYAEDLCLNANVNYTIKTYVVPMKCKHVSWGNVDRTCNLAIDYINSKYPDKKWAGTCTHL